MIPKVIHYCWFGGEPLPPLAETCIASWKKFCPEYQIVEWNEKNYSLEQAPAYVKEAIAAKRWAFATDYIRLDVIDQFGGIYLDTDVELLKGLDEFLLCDAFFARDRNGAISTGLGFGAVKNNACVRSLKEDYHDIHFQLGPVSFDTMPCPQRNKSVFDQFGFSDDTNIIESQHGIIVYPREYFAPMDMETMKLYLTDKTYSIHHYSASWKTARERKSHERRRFLVLCFGKQMGNGIADFVNGVMRKILKIYDYINWYLSSI